MKQSTTSVNFRKRWTQSAASLLNSLAACAISLVAISSVHAQEKSTTRQIESLAEAYDLQNQGVANGQSRIIFYNPSTSSLPGAATVYINGRYHTSLIAGAYSPVCLPPGKVELGTRQIEIQKRANKDGLDSITLLSLQNGQNQYVRVQGDSRKNIALMPVSAIEAQKELTQTRLQIHTISRVSEAVECVNAASQAQTASAAAFKTAAPSLRQMQLSGDTLFAFDRSDAAGLTQQGLRAIEQLTAQIKSEFSRIDRVHVIGHTDPFGSDAYNDKLSAQRALTVKQNIQERGQFNGPVTSEGRGKRQLVVTHCGQEETPTNIACNQPNRRVSIEVTGIASKP